MHASAARRATFVAISTPALSLAWQSPARIAATSATVPFRLMETTILEIDVSVPNCNTVSWVDDLWDEAGASSLVVK